jgi:hypothetical protein
MFLLFKLRPKMSLREIPQRAVKTSWYFDRKRSPARKLVDSSIERGHYLTNKKIITTFKAALKSVCVSVLYSFFFSFVGPTTVSWLVVLFQKNCTSLTVKNYLDQFSFAVIWNYVLWICKLSLVMFGVTYQQI